MFLYKFRALAKKKDYKRIISIIENGFYCNTFFNFNDMNEGVYVINNKNIGISLDDKKKYKICSFSGVNALDNELMWGHYANAGMGVAIEIDVAVDVKKPKKIIQHVKEIKYGKNKNGLDTIEEILTHKSDAWSYEDEFRYIAKHEKINVEIGKITKIYFGTPYKNLTNYTDFKDKHPGLKEYLKFQDKLKDYCKRNENGIECKDFEFNFY